MKIAIAQINPVIGDFKENLQRILAFTDRAKDADCELVVFSELVLSGYPPRDLLEKSSFVEANRKCLERLIAEVSDICVICGTVESNPEPDGNPLFNAAVAFVNGQILHCARKRLLPNYDIFDERRFFEPGRETRCFDYKGIRIGLTICEDAWNDKEVFEKRRYHTNPVADAVHDGADLIVNISASPYHRGRREFRWNMHGAMAKKYGIPFIFSNQVGGNDSVLYDGLSAAYDRNGKPVAVAADFEEDLVVFDTASMTGQCHPISDTEAATVLKGLIAGTRDYVTKCGFSKVVVGLSGGIDSALTLYIAVQALGTENVSAVFMPSAYTSQDNFEDTRALADNLGIRLETIPIDAMYREFTRCLSPGFKENDPGITEQNIQARIRGTLLMGISNRDGCLVLSTGNKSELAVGYCTLYGDMNGGLAVISDVPKTMVWELSVLANAAGEIIPLRIIEKPPSAELKPDQTDQDDLPAYEVIDPIIREYIEEFKGVEEIVAMGYDRKIVEEVIVRIDRNEYKRHQAAPGLRITPKAFGEGRRYPLAKRLRPVD